jgi:GNAT superfamily N-acetyltransferase
LIRAHAAFEGGESSITEAVLMQLLQLKRPPVRLFIAERTGRIIGYAALTTDFSLWRASRWAHLDCLFVGEGERGSGTGKLLLRRILKAAHALRADRLEWQTPEWNREAIRFYQREQAIGVAKARFHLALR